MNKGVLKATHEGKLKIGETELDCAVLEDGTRIISRNAIFRAFGRTKRGRAKSETRVLNRPAFIDARNLQPFIGNDLESVLTIVEYIDKNGKENSGYNALIIPMLCKVYLDSRATINPDTNKLYITKQQIPLARASEKLLLGLSNIGIIALVDEATGYQYDREKDELQKILKAYIAEELLPWQKRFPDVYYKELFRLNGWDFTVHGIKKRPGVIGKWTNSLVYERLPKGVLEELKKRTPKSESGHYLARFHQNLTLDIGDPNLTAQLNKVITLFQLSDDMEHMWHQFNKLKNREEGQLEIPFPFDELGHTKEPIYEEKELSNFNKKLRQAIEFKQ